MSLWLRVLGGARVEGPDGPLRGRAAHRRRLAVLALLAAAPRRTLGRERLIGYLWPDSPADAARHLLSESLHVLRKELDENLFLSSGDEIGLNPEILRCDLIEFSAAIAAGDWKRAVEYYGGPLLDGFYVDDAPEFERWAEARREELAREYARALEALAEASEAAGDPVAAAAWWTRFAVHDPFNSRIALRLMEALAAGGERARAIQFSAIHSARLREELGIDPDPEIERLVERLRSEPPEPRPADRAAPAISPAGHEMSPAVTPEPPVQGEHDEDLPRLGPEFEVIRLIGEGSVAAVYLAREPALGRLVAVKVLAPQLAADETSRLRFEREAQAAARLQHPNVASVFRIGRLPQGVPFIVLPFIGGGSLADRLAAYGPLPVEEVRRFIGQIAAALVAAHRLGIVHRDVRPENILYDRDHDRVLLTDFGLAAVLETGHERVKRLTRPGERLGNPAYASPEQLRGEPVTERADIYSLGIVTFELLTGRFPYDAETTLQMTAAHVRAEPKRASELRVDIDPALDDLIRRCLSKRPEHRPFAADILAALGSAPTSQASDWAQRARRASE
jgi:DNA-binding SARP family transcriptional activator/tRNA A-37 threonylcarbamoyl transferase component Bud32